MEFQYLKISCYFISLHFDLFLSFVIIAFSFCYQYDYRVADVINLTSFVSTDNVKYSVLIIFTDVIIDTDIIRFLMLKMTNDIPLWEFETKFDLNQAEPSH